MLIRVRNSTKNGIHRIFESSTLYYFIYLIVVTNFLWWPLRHSVSTSDGRAGTNLNFTIKAIYLHWVQFSNPSARQGASRRAVLKNGWESDQRVLNIDLDIRKFKIQKTVARYGIFRYTLRYVFWVDPLPWRFSSVQKLLIFELFLGYFPSRIFLHRLHKTLGIRSGAEVKGSFNCYK